MKTKRIMFLLVIAGLGLFQLSLWALTNNQAGTNGSPLLPGLTPTGQVDVVSLINLLIMVLTPILTQGWKWVFPRLPNFTLNLIAPVMGALIGMALHAAGVTTTTGWGAAIWGGLGTWLYELAANAKDFVQKPQLKPATR